MGGHPLGKSLRPGQPAGSVEPPDWAGEAPECDHGQKRQYKYVLTKRGEPWHIWECAAISYPDPGQCAAVTIDKPKENK